MRKTSVDKKQALQNLKHCSGI